MATFTPRIGYGQVEPNHLSAIRNGQVYAQLPAAASISTLENGQMVKYDAAAGEVNVSTSNGLPWMLVYNEEKLYDERKQMHRDWIQDVKDSYDGKIYPRVFALHAGDIFTTNTLAVATAGTAIVAGNILTVDANGFLTLDTATAPAGKFKVAAVTTLPDGQDAVKIQVME